MGQIFSQKLPFASYSLQFCCNVIDCCVNPTVIQAIRDKEDLSEALAESDKYSAQLLSERLGDSAHVEKVYHGLISGVEAIGNAGSMLAGPFGPFVALCTATFSVLLQLGQSKKLQALAAGIEEKMRTDENGNEQTIAEYFEGIANHI